MYRAFVLCTIVLLAALSPDYVEAQQRQARDQLDTVELQLSRVTERLNVLRAGYLIPSQLDGMYLDEQRLADGTVLFILGDYVRAALVLMNVVENSIDSNVSIYREARYYLADSLFLAGNPLAARSYFREIADDRADDHRLDAIKRLIEIAFQTGHSDNMNYLYGLLEQEPSARNRSDLQYVRGKALYVQGDYSASSVAFSQVGRDAIEFVPAQYFLGTAFVQMADWERAIGAFETARDSAEGSDYAGAQEISDLASLAIGRIHYELEDLGSARLAYQLVPRISDHFDRALYEMCWTYIGEERYQDALQTLEILLMSVPESRFRPRVQLLQGDLLIKMANYPAAMVVFDETVARFGPIAEQLGSVVEEMGGQEGYLDVLFGGNAAGVVIPDIARDWVVTEAVMEQALAIVDDLESQEVEIAESEEIIEEIEAVLNSSSALDAFRELREGFGNALELKSTLLSLLGDLADIEGLLVVQHIGAGERQRLAELQSRRRAIQQQLENMPTTFAEITDQEQSVESEISALEMEVFRLGYEVESGRSQIRALTFQIQEERNSNLRSEEEYRWANAELQEETGRIEQLEQRREALRRELEQERLSVGLASVAAGTQEDFRIQFSAALSEEITYLSGLRTQVPLDGRDILVRLDESRRQVQRADVDLDSFFQEIQQIVDEQTDDIRRQLSIENAKLADYDQRLREYGGRGQRLASTLAYESFLSVQGQFHELVLNADVGIIDVAWREKEDRSERIDALFDERNQQLNVFDIEFQEVLSID